jgi:hypothetical protein
MIEGGGNQVAFGDGKTLSYVVFTFLVVYSK